MADFNNFYKRIRTKIVGTEEKKSDESNGAPQVEEKKSTSRAKKYEEEVLHTKAGTELEGEPLFKFAKK